MSTNNPFDFSNMFKMFDPNDVQKYFEPSNMFSMLQPARTNPFDMTGIMDSNRKNYDAMLEANKSAAAAYQDLLEKQMEVFGQLTNAAREHTAWIDESAGPEAFTKKSEAYGEAVEKALILMRKLAESARDANEDAFSEIKGQVTDAMDELQKKGK